MRSRKRKSIKVDREMNRESETKKVNIGALSISHLPNFLCFDWTIFALDLTQTHSLSQRLTHTQSPRNSLNERKTIEGVTACQDIVIRTTQKKSRQHFDILTFLAFYQVLLQGTLLVGTDEFYYLIKTYFIFYTETRNKEQGIWFYSWAFTI